MFFKKRTDMIKFQFLKILLIAVEKKQQGKRLQSNPVVLVVIQVYNVDSLKYSDWSETVRFQIQEGGLKSAMMALRIPPE